MFLFLTTGFKAVSLSPDFYFFNKVFKKTFNQTKFILKFQNINKTPAPDFNN